MPFVILKWIPLIYNNYTTDSIWGYGIECAIHATPRRWQYDGLNVLYYELTIKFPVYESDLMITK
jgi:hypothetical protein